VEGQAALALATTRSKNWRGVLRETHLERRVSRNLERQGAQDESSCKTFGVGDLDPPHRARGRAADARHAGRGERRRFESASAHDGRRRRGPLAAHGYRARGTGRGWHRGSGSADCAGGGTGYARGSHQHSREPRRCLRRGQGHRRRAQPEGDSRPGEPRGGPATGDSQDGPRRRDGHPRRPPRGVGGELGRKRRRLGGNAPPADPGQPALEEHPRRLSRRGTHRAAVDRDPQRTRRQAHPRRNRGRRAAGGDGVHLKPGLGQRRVDGEGKPRLEPHQRSRWPPP